jgi:hypothetical protein
MQATRLTEAIFCVASVPGLMHRRYYSRRRRQRPGGSPPGPLDAVSPAHGPVVPGPAPALSRPWNALPKSAANPPSAPAATPDLSESLCAAAPPARGLRPAQAPRPEVLIQAVPPPLGGTIDPLIGDDPGCGVISVDPGPPDPPRNLNDPQKWCKWDPCGGGAILAPWRLEWICRTSPWPQRSWWKGASWCFRYAIGHRKHHEARINHEK